MRNRISDIIVKILGFCGVRLTSGERFAFLGWKDTAQREKFHDSPGFFECEWVAGRVPQAPPYPNGLFTLGEEATKTDGTRVMVISYDHAVLGKEDITRLLAEAGILCKPE